MTHAAARTLALGLALALAACGGRDSDADGSGDGSRLPETVEKGKFVAEMAGVAPRGFRGAAAFCTDARELMVILGRPALRGFTGLFRLDSNERPPVGEHPVRPVAAVDTTAFSAILPRVKAEGGGEYDMEATGGTVRITASEAGRIAGTFRLDVRARSLGPVEYAAEGDTARNPAPADEFVATLAGTFDAIPAGECAEYVRW